MQQELHRAAVRGQPLAAQCRRAVQVRLRAEAVLDRLDMRGSSGRIRLPLLGCNLFTTHLSTYVERYEFCLALEHVRRLLRTILAPNKQPVYQQAVL